jgi:hypothetical protein
VGGHGEPNRRQAVDRIEPKCIFEPGAIVALESERAKVGSVGDAAFGMSAVAKGTKAGCGERCQSGKAQEKGAVCRPEHPGDASDIAGRLDSVGAEGRDQIGPDVLGAAVAVQGYLGERLSDSRALLLDPIPELGSSIPGRLCALTGASAQPGRFGN